MFPQLENTGHENVRFKNVDKNVYLCVTEDENGKRVLGTKTLNQDMDPEVDFSLYYYKSAEVADTKMVLPVHQATKSCLSLSSEKKLELTSLRTLADIESNEVDDIGLMEEPEYFTQADNRFFYIRSSYSSYNALEAMNGKHYNNFLCVNSSNDPDIQEHDDFNYPESILFSIEIMDNNI